MELGYSADEIDGLKEAAAIAEREGALLPISAPS